MFLYDFVSNLISFELIFFFIDNITEKVVFSVIYVYVFDSIIHFWFIFLILICYMWTEMVMNVFVFLDVLSNNSKY